jgi:hypothetical protein
MSFLLGALGALGKKALQTAEQNVAKGKVAQAAPVSQPGGGESVYGMDMTNLWPGGWPTPPPRGRPNGGSYLP